MFKSWGWADEQYLLVFQLLCFSEIVIRILYDLRFLNDGVQSYDIVYETSPKLSPWSDKRGVSSYFPNFIFQ